MRALAATTILPGLLVSIGTETTLRPPTVAAAAPGRRTVTAIVPDEAGRRRTSACRFPYSSCLPANDTVSMGRTTSAKGADVARSAVATTGPGAPALAWMRKPPLEPVTPWPSAPPRPERVTGTPAAAGRSAPVSSILAW